MPNQSLTKQPTVLAGLTADTWYTVQNDGAGLMFFEEASAVPTNIENAFKLTTLQTADARKTAGTEIYVWASGVNENSRVVYAESGA